MCAALVPAAPRCPLLTFLPEGLQRLQDMAPLGSRPQGIPLKRPQGCMAHMGVQGSPGQSGTVRGQHTLAALPNLHPSHPVFQS